MKPIFTLCYLFAAFYSAGALAQNTLFVYSGTNGLHLASTYPGLVSYNLDPKGLFGSDHPDYARWQVETGLPIPRVAPAVVDQASGVVVPVRGGDIETALTKLSIVVSSHPAGQRKARIEGNRTSNAFTTMTNNMSQFVSNYEDMTNMVATSSFTSNQLKNILGKQAKAMDALYDVLKKVVPVLRNNVEDQK